jgi:hypothetical protein
VNDPLLLFDEFLRVTLFLVLDDRLEPVVEEFGVSLLVIVHEWHQVDWSDLHEDDLALFGAATRAFIILHDPALAHVHRWVVVLSADLDLLLTFCIE